MKEPLYDISIIRDVKYNLWLKISGDQMHPASTGQVLRLDLLLCEVASPRPWSQGGSGFINSPPGV
jgi:hypothetical protein